MLSLCINDCSARSRQDDKNKLDELGHNEHLEGKRWKGLSL